MTLLERWRSALRTPRSAPGWLRLPHVALPRLAVAASLVVLLAAASFWLLRPQPSLAQFREVMTAASWSGAPHVAFESRDLAKIREWLKAQGAPNDFSLPKAVRDMTPRGCRIVEWRGHKVTQLCLLGSTHLHLVVCDQTAFAHVPPEPRPDFEICHGWKTVSWNYRDHTFVLVGMNYFTFIKKSRHDGQWNWAG